ncbi:response regulator [Caenimonas sedimenti]|uniref:Virulence sensor protein BvgS n=1 Tax=Caenimonas sedimenti TaxID=2596921 RepID=A0A562ZQ60_9BURK|nr:response regulator [Caenimonas sedimenti]TWO70304.1 response regulator [Caenimonas sedimenti]
MRLVPLRRILAASLVLLAAVPALLVAWTLGRAGSASVEELGGRILTHVAEGVQAGTENQLQSAHDVLNGLFPERLNAAQTAKAREWLRNLPRFEPTAFVITRMSPEVPTVHFANLRGEYFGVEAMPEATKVAMRAMHGTARSFWLAQEPGDRRKPLPVDASSFEPRTTIWYSGAMQAKDRVFSPVRVSPERKQLMVSLSQPVFDADGGAAGVFGADLYLQRLAEVLRTQRISARGAAFVIDDKNQLVASSAGDALFVEFPGGFALRTPKDSANTIIRAGFSALEGLRARKSEDSVAADTRLQRLPLENDTLLMVQRPFGEALGLRWTLVVAAPESDFTGEITKASKQAATGGVVLVALGTLIAFLLARGIGRRLGRLSLAAEQLGRGEVPVIQGDTRIREVRQLSQVLHDSAEQLQAFRAQVRKDAEALQQANETLEARVEERTAELTTSREEALAAARAKAAFLATMSHEIRTPLNGVVGMSTLLAETPLNSEQRDYLETIRLSSDQLLAVINDILDFSKIESGKLELEEEPVALRAAVEEACDIAAPRAREKGLELIIDIPETGPGAVPAAIKGDVTRLRQVLINLINNAVKFTAKGEVAVHVRQLKADDGQGRALLEFRVSDTGIGIPPERVNSLFEAFTQVDASTTRKYGGTGLGLAICKRLVELMDGQLGVESDYGKGSTFWFTVAAPVTELAPSFSPADAGRLMGARVLVVDDHATNVRVLTRQLQLWDMQVATAESAREALDWLRQTVARPEVIITDMHMPDMDGVAFAAALKDEPAWRDIPIVLLSSGFMPAAHESAQLFQARLLKPARQSQLFETVLRCLAPEAAGAVVAPAVVDNKKHATVLVADDNAVNLKVACAMLLKLGYEVRTAADGQQAVEAVAQAAARKERIAAILMDVNMPELDGLEATRQIQSAWGDEAPPIIAVTAAASDEDRARCEAAGMDAYLTKPLQVAALAQALEKWIGVVEAPAGAAPAGPVTAAPSAAPAVEPAAPLMDFSRLEEFREFDDEELTLTREVIGLFTADTPARLEAIAAAVAAQDAAALAVAAHALKGSASNVGATALHLAAGSLETDAKAGWPGDAAERSAELNALWVETRKAIEGWA